MKILACTDVPDRAARTLPELVMTLRMIDARISMRLCRLPDDDGDAVRQAQLNLRGAIAALQAIGAVS